MQGGFSGAVRQKALQPGRLRTMERHGKREDASSKARRIRDEAPLVYGTLNLTEARAAHMQDVKQSGKSSAVHALVQFPTALIDADHPEQQEMMLKHAVHFMNRFHGGDAVFSARLDRDERGRHTVDVFLMPRYEFTYKDGRTVKKASVSRFAKAEALRRFGSNDRRAQGSALQDAWFEYMRDEMQLPVQRPKRKQGTAADRVEPEFYALERDKEKLIAAGSALLTGMDAVDAGQLYYKQDTDQIMKRKIQKPIIREDVFPDWAKRIRPFSKLLKSYAKRMSRVLKREAELKDMAEELRALGRRQAGREAASGTVNLEAQKDRAAAIAIGRKLHRHNEEPR